MNMKCSIPMGVGGEFKFSKGKADADGNLIPGTMQDVTDWFSNHVLDVGLDMIGTAANSSATNDPAFKYLSGAQIGSGNTPPEDEDTELDNRLASSVTRLSQTQNKNLSVLPYYFEITMVYRFGAGVGTGTIAECAIVYGESDGAAMSPSAPMFARALTVDSAGNPITVPKLSDEIVDLHYRLRYYIPNTDVVGTINIGGVDYDYTLRPVRVERNQASLQQFGWGFTALQTSGHNSSIYARSSEVGFSPNRIYTGASADLAPISGSDPTGTSLSQPNNFSVSNPTPYVGGSHELEQRISCPLGSAGTGVNDPAGMGVFVFSTGISSWQLKLEPNLVKTADDLFNISIFHTWGRFTP